jgi:hypothetical protein
MITVCQSTPTRVIITYTAKIINDELYSELKKIGIVQDRIKEIEIDNINDKMIVNMR